MITVRYFARFREQLGIESEQINIASGSSVTDLISLLHERGDAWAEIFAEDQLVMMAVNQEMTDAAAVIDDGDEVAFFPPVTGG